MLRSVDWWLPTFRDNLSKTYLFKYERNARLWRCLFACFLYYHVSVTVVTIFRVSRDRSTITILIQYIQEQPHSRLMYMLLVQPLTDLRKGCVPRNFTQVEFYVGIFLYAYAAFATMRAEFDRSKKELISNENIIKHPLLSNFIRFCFPLFATGCLTFHDFFKFAPAGKNLPQVELA